MRLARPSALLTALSAAVVVAAAAPAQAAPTATDTRSARTAAGWLGRQFVDGNHLETTWGGTAYADAGLTLDGVLALAAAKVGDGTGRAALEWVSEPSTLASYVGDGTTESYAGAHGKLILTLRVRGKNARDVAGRNLVAELQSLQQPNGRLTDRSAWGDYSNMFTQSFGVLALKRTGAAVNAPATYLATQACPDGGLPIQLEQATCTSTVDATALGVQALLATGRKAKAHRALRWLVSQQQPDGGFGNANSTGLAAAALEVGGYAAPAARARANLRSLQVDCADTANAGAIAYDGTGFDSTTAPRATTQAVLGLAGANLATLTSAGSVTRLPVRSCGAGS